MATRGYRTIKMEIKGEAVSVYTSARLADALETLAEDLSLYHGVKLAQIMEAVYLQGRKDGANAAFEHLDRGLAQAKEAIPHTRPGRPKKVVRRRKG